MNAHALLTTAVPITPPPVAGSARTWPELLVELTAARADWYAKAHLTDSIALGREPTEHETAIADAASERHLSAVWAVVDYTPPDIRIFLEKTALLADQDMMAGITANGLMALARDAAALQAGPPADVSPRPDAELLALGSEMERRWALEREACLREGSTDAELDAVDAHTGEVAHRIMGMPSTTLDGFRVKARAVAWCFGADPQSTEFADQAGQTSTAHRFADRFFRELLSTAGPEREVDPAAALARDLAAAEREAAGLASGAENTRLEDEALRLRTQIALTPSTSIPGAMAQVAALFGLMWAMFDGCDTQEWEGDMALAAEAANNAIDCLARLSSVEPGQVGCGAFMGRYARSEFDAFARLKDLRAAGWSVTRSGFGVPETTRPDQWALLAELKPFQARQVMALAAECE